METTIIQRIELICKFKGMSVLKFSQTIDFNYPTLNNYVTGRRKAIDIELICKILVVFPDISAEWILLEVGTMIKEKRQMTNEKSQDSTNEMMLKTIIELSGKNALLEEKIKTLESEKIYLKVADKETSYTKKK